MPTKPPAQSSRSVKLKGRTIPYSLRTSRRHRRIRLYVSCDGVEVVTPPGVSRGRVEEVLQQFGDWVLDRLEAAANAPDSTHLLLCGREYEVRVEAGEPGVIVAGGRVTIRTYHDRHPRSVLADWLGDEAGKDILSRLQVHAPKLNVSWGKVYVKDQKTLWGSCTGRNNLCFNYRLVMAPPEILDYVVIHEVSHLVHRNHSKAFWAVVGSLCPEYKLRVKWLKEHGPNLRLPRLSAVTVRRPEPQRLPLLSPPEPTPPARPAKRRVSDLQLDLPW